MDHSVPAGMQPDRRAFWNERYATEGYVFGVDANRFVVEELSDVPAGRALDLGCGQGRNAVWLAAQGHRVTAVDLSEVAVEQGRLLAAEAGVEVEFVVADVLVWDSPAAAFDLVVLSYIQLDEARRSVVHAKASEALAPGGLLFVVAHHAENLEHGVGGPQLPDLLYDEAQLAGDFAGLEVQRNERVLRPVERDGAAGVAIDILFVATKSEA
ncbi:MAG TPA: class I SAM-dependent methyltransferase [Acidimicrobiia bacterium]|jgi:SAM-dependent methyltransferase